MAASDHLSGQQFFHGSTDQFKPGEVLDPKSYGRPFFFAGNKTEPTSGNYGAHLYEVKPIGGYESDPALAHIPELESYMTHDPVKIVRKLKMPPPPPDED